MEKRYSGKWSPNVLANCCWILIRKTPNGKYKRQKRRINVYLTNFPVVRMPYMETISLFDTVCCN